MNCKRLRDGLTKAVARLLVWYHEDWLLSSAYIPVKPSPANNCVYLYASHFGEDRMKRVAASNSTANATAFESLTSS